MPKISFKGIGTPDPSQSKIYDAWAEYKGARMEEIPVGENFEIFARGRAVNIGALAWETLFTAISDDGTLAAYNPTDAAFEVKETGTVKITANWPSGYGPFYMPDRDIVIKVSLWANETRGQPIPPVSQW